MLRTIKDLFKSKPKYMVNNQILEDLIIRTMNSLEKELKESENKIIEQRNIYESFIKEKDIDTISNYIGFKPLIMSTVKVDNKELSCNNIFIFKNKLLSFQDNESKILFIHFITINYINHIFNNLPFKIYVGTEDIINYNNNFYLKEVNKYLKDNDLDSELNAMDLIENYNEFYNTELFKFISYTIKTIINAGIEKDREYFKKTLLSILDVAKIFTKD